MAHSKFQIRLLPTELPRPRGAVQQGLPQSVQQPLVERPRLHSRRGRQELEPRWRMLQGILARVSTKF